ncbi:hypothetical protein EAE96_010274 [Botrytis aclada]|nr:hypothetical protein EAE96_010274 [Botrytis aclada]
MAPNQVSNEMDRECVICLSSLDSIPHGNEGCQTCETTVCSTASISTCGHQAFHYCCLRQWKDNNNSNTCPYCRAPFATINRFLEIGEHRLMVLVPPDLFTFQQDRSLFLHYMAPQDIGRTEIYTYRLLSHPTSGNFHRVTPQDIAGSEVLQRRIRDFIIRDFQIAYVPLQRQGIPTEVTEIFGEEISSFLVDCLKKHDLRENVNELKQAMSRIFRPRHRGEIFLHELTAWMESGCDTLDQWDRSTRYTALPIIPCRLRPRMPQRGVQFEQGNYSLPSSNI